MSMLVVQSEQEYQHTRWKQAQAGLGVNVPGVAARRAREAISRVARMKMKALLDAQIKAIDIIPRGKRVIWLKAIELIDPDVLADDDRRWREEVTAIILEHGENLARVRGGNRNAKLVSCRRAIATALYARGWSLPRIGHLMGGRDHTSIYSLLHPERNLKRYARLKDRAALEDALVKKQNPPAEGR